MYLFLCVSVLCLMFLCVIPVLCLWALLPELKLMMMMIKIIVPQSGQTGRRGHNVLNLFVRLSVRSSVMKLVKMIF